MSQILGERRPITRRPAGITPWIGALIRAIAVGAIKVQQQMHLASDRIVPVRRRALDAGLDDGGVASGPRPRPEEARVRGFHKDRLLGLVLHEAQEGRAVDGHDGQVDDVGGRLVDEGLWCREGLEVAGVRVADADVGGGARVPGVGGWILRLR